MSRAEELNQALEVLAREQEITPLKSFEMVFEAAKADDFVFDFKDGFQATYQGVNPFSAQVVKEFLFNPVRNDVYRRRRREIGDDFDFAITDSDKLMELADQYLDFKEGKAN